MHTFFLLFVFNETNKRKISAVKIEFVQLLNFVRPAYFGNIHINDLHIEVGHKTLCFCMSIDYYTDISRKKIDDFQSIDYSCYH